MSSIDSRIVTMKFDNAAFQRGVSATMSSLDKLKSALTKLPGATKGLDTLSSAASRFNLGNMDGAISGVSAKFIAMSTVAITALANITNRAIDAGATIVKSLTISPVMDGFHEYETNLNSIQTIMANTGLKGQAGLDKVNAALNDLNRYSDKTIYNFSEMARNIGTFTSAGVDLQTATDSIKGIANLAALSGSNSQQASTAMYQLSQAISAGRVGLQDWNSVVNAGMGGKVFQQALTRTAVNMGVLNDGALALSGPMKKLTVNSMSFRDSIRGTPTQSSWLTGEVLTNTLKQLSGEMTNAELRAQGFTKAQIKSIQAMAKTGLDAATKVKTLSQLMSTVKEAIGSGWAKTFQLVFGDFGEAKKTFTEASNTINHMVKVSARARNMVLKDWKELGGRNVLIKGIKNLFNALLDIVKPIHDAFREVFPAKTGRDLYNLTKEFRRFTAHLKIGADTADKVRRIFKGVFAIFDIGWMVLKNVAHYFLALIPLFGQGSGGVLDLVAAVADLVSGFDEWLKKGDYIKKFFDNIIDGRAALLGPIIAAIGRLVSAFAGLVGSGAEKFIDLLQVGFARIAPIAQTVSLAIAALIDGIRTSLSKIDLTSQIDAIKARVSDFADTVQAKIDSLDLSSKFEAAKTIIVGFVDEIVSKINSIDFSGLLGIGDKLKSILPGAGAAAGGGLSSLGKSLDIGAKASAAVKSLGQVKQAVDPLKSLVDTLKSALEGLMNILGTIGSVFYNSFAKPLFAAIKSGIDWVKNKISGVNKGDALLGGLVALDAALLFSWYRMIKKFFTNVSDLVGNISNTFDSISKVFDQVTNNLKTMQRDVRANIILKIAIALGILTAAIVVLSKIDPKQLAYGLGAVAAMLLIVTVALKSLEDETNRDGKLFEGGRMVLLSASLIALSVAILILAVAVKILGKMDVKTLSKGLGAVAAIIGVVVAASALLEKSGGAAQILIASVAMGLLAVSLTAFAGAVELYSKIDGGKLLNGGLKIVAAIAAIGIAMQFVPKDMILSAAALFIVANALVIMAGALKLFGTMSPGEISKSLITLAIALGIIGLAMAGMTEGLPGAAAMLVMAAALNLLAPALMLLGSMSMETIGKSLLVLVGVFTVLGVAGYVLAPVVPVIVALAGGIALLGLAALAVGVGLLAFATGLATLAVSGAAGAAVLTAAIISISATIPIIMAQFGLGVIAFAKVIGKAGPALVQAFTAVLKSLIQAVINVTPKFGKMLQTMALTGLRVLRNLFPAVVATGIALILALLNGVEKHISDIANKAASIIVKFINALGNNLPKIVDAGARMVIKLVNGVSDAIDRHSAEMGRAGARLGVSIIHGMISGIGGAVGGLVDSAINAAQSALDAVKSHLHINSPSKKFRDEVGRSIPEGIADGIDREAPRVSDSAVKLGKTALDTLSSTMSGISDVLDSHVDMNPTIAPVLDLTQMTKEANKMSSILATSPVSPSVSYGNASNISAQTRLAQNESGNAVKTATTEIKFEQNNYSPKAISSTEVYRQTRNQLSLAKEALNTL